MHKIRFIFLNSTPYADFWLRVQKHFRPDEYTEISFFEHWQKNGDFDALKNLKIPLEELPFFIGHSWGNALLLRHLIGKVHKKAYAIMLEPEEFPISDDAKKALKILRKMEKIHLSAYLRQMYRQICLENNFLTNFLNAAENNENFIKACVYEAIGILLSPNLIPEIFQLPYNMLAGFPDYGAGDDFFEKRTGDFPFNAHHNFRVVRFHHCDHFCFNGPGEDILLAAISGAIRKHEKL
jgi:hypothetical protein